ncbi:MAG: BatD family protein [Bacteroidetes bacterium]|nr:BatD family protein [Bacteroidota bacterium]
MKRIIFFILLITGLIYTSKAEDVRFTASAPSTVGSGQQFAVTFSVNAAGSSFSGPNFKGFSVLSGPNQSSSTSMQFINGNMTQSVSYSFTYYLQAGNEGTFTIGPAKITIGGKTYESNALTVKVVKGTPNSNQQNNQQNRQQQNNQPSSLSENDIFIKTSVSNASPLQGEQIIVTYKLYTSVAVSQYSINKLASNKGFWSEDLLKENERPKQYKENLNGKQYIVAEIRKVALFPQDVGTLNIQPLEVDVVAQLPSQRRKTNSIFDFFDDPFASSYQNVKKTIKSNNVSVNVRALPAANKPADFSGAVGNYTYRSDFSKTETKANEAVNLKFTISGRGNIKLIDKLDVKFPPDFEVYDPKINDNINKSENGISGTKTFDYLIIPRNEGVFTIKAVNFTYFDLNKGKYITLSSPEYTLKVAKGDGKQSSATLTSVNQEEIKYIGSDIEHIKTKPMDLNKKGVHFFLSELYYILCLIPFILFIIAIIFRRKHLKLRSNLALLKNRKATKIAKKRLKKASKYLGSKEKDKFYIEISQALWGYMSDKFNIPLAELSMDSVNEALHNKGIKEELASQFIKTLHNCEFARFAPGDESLTMDNIYKEAIEIISKTENELK